jgi:hypothetical protein
VPETNNIPPRYQALVLQAIEATAARRAQLEADGTLMDTNALVDEAYKQLLLKAQASGVSAEEFIPEHRYYLAAGLRKVVRWALAFSKEYPATHRKGYGEADLTILSTPAPVIFYFGGGGSGGPGEGPGEPDWPDPEEWDPYDGPLEPLPDYGGHVADRWNQLNMDELQQQAFLRDGKAGIQQLQIHFTRKIALDMIDDGIDAWLEFYHNPIPGTSIYLEPAIVLVDGFGPTQSAKVIGGSARDNWTFGHPQWYVGRLPNPNDRRDPVTADIGPSPF